VSLRFCLHGHQSGQDEFVVAVGIAIDRSHRMTRPALLNSPLQNC
jgi:hypothetical protein